MPSLVIIDGPVHGLPVDGQVVVGRDGTCDIVLSRHSVSRRHAIFHCRAGQVFVEDLGSNNGTFVNGVEIHGEVRLADQDRINLYDVPLRFHEGDVEPPETNRGFTTIDRIRELDDVQRRLDLVIELGRRLGSTLEVDEVLPRVLDLLFQVFRQAENGEILLANESGQLQPQAMKTGRADDSNVLTSTPEISPLALRVFTSGNPELVVEAGDDQSVLESDVATTTICAPLVGPSDGPCGVVLLEASGVPDLFEQADLELLVVIGLLAGQAIENAHTHRRIVVVEQKRIEMSTAREVQESILPRRPPVVPGYEFHDHYLPADLVGGDFFDYVRLVDFQLVISLGDICGKGLPAALQMAQVSRDVRHALATSDSLKAAVRLLNAFILDRDGGLVTLATCMLDLENHRASFVSAGHVIPLRRRNGVVEPVFDIDRGGLPLGVLAEADWHVTTVDVETGDEFVIVTDGIVEQQSPGEDFGERFGGERLTSAFEGAARGVENVVEHIIDAVDDYRGDRTRSDDRCIVAFARVA